MAGFGVMTTQSRDYVCSCIRTRGSHSQPTSAASEGYILQGHPCPASAASEGYILQGHPCLAIFTQHMCVHANFQHRCYAASLMASMCNDGASCHCANVSLINKCGDQTLWTRFALQAVHHCVVNPPRCAVSRS